MEFSGAEILVNIFFGFITAVVVLWRNQKRRRRFWGSIYKCCTLGLALALGVQILCEIVCHTESDPPLATWWYLNFAETCGLGSYILSAIVCTCIVAPGRRDLRALLGK